MKRVWRIVVQIGLVLVLVLSGILGSPTPVAYAQSVNEVFVGFRTDYDYVAPGNSFTNGEVMGIKGWGSSLERKEASGVPVTDVGLTLVSTLSFDWIDPVPSTPGPPIEWSFGEVPDESGVGVNLGVGTPVPFTPGFHASRSVDRTQFTGWETQTLTISVTPLEPAELVDYLTINVDVWEDENVIPTITSPTTDEAEGIWLHDGQNLNIRIESPEQGTTYTYDVTIEVAPKVAEVEFMPHVGIGSGKNVDSGTTSGSSLSHTVAEVGTWTWSAQGNDVWQWWEELVRWVGFEGYSREIFNYVQADFQTIWTYDVPGDTFADGTVTGRKQWHANLGNRLEVTGESVTALGLTLGTELTQAFDHLMTENLVLEGPPTYGWFFGDLPVGAGAVAYAGFVEPNLFPVSFTPGFDATRSADITQFSEPGTQTLTITVTPRQAMPGFAVGVQADETPWVNPVITDVSVFPPSDDAFTYELSPDGHSLSMWQHHEPAVGTEFTYTVTIEVTPTASAVELLPYVMIGRHEVLASGMSSGNSISHPVDPEGGVGTWTWNAGASYPWYWTDNRMLDISFPHYSRANEVSLHFNTNYDYGVPGDSFTNGEVMGNKNWKSGLHRTEAVPPVTDVRLSLDSPLELENIHPEPFDMGPPIEWRFGDVAPGEDVGVEVGSSSQVLFAPGLDASRVVDRTHFTAPDTQHLTIIVKPQQQQPWDDLTINVDVWEDENVIPTITSPTTDPEVGIWLSDDGRHLQMRIENPVVGTTYTHYVTMEVTPLVPEVEFMPHVSVRWGENIASSTGSGSSLSHPIPELGTWTWSATGNYVWHWNENLQRSVYFAGYTRVNEVYVNFDTHYHYAVPGDSFTNGEVMGNKNWGSSLHRREAMSPATDTRLTLDSSLEFNWIEPEPFDMGPPIEWRFGDVAPESSVAVGVDPGSLVAFVPGFDASRLVDTTHFTEPDTQNIAIAITPQQAFEELFIDVGVREAQYATATIVSPTTDEAQGIWLSPDGQELHIETRDLVGGDTYTFCVTIEVTPGMPEVEFMPHVSIGWREHIASGIASSSSLSHLVPELGTWTWSATDTYVWKWWEGLDGRIHFEGYSRANEVYVNFAAHYYHVVPGDSFTNGEVMGNQNWDSSLHRKEAVSPATDVGLSLESDLEFGWIEPEPISGPPVYGWFFGDVPPESDVWVNLNPGNVPSPLVPFVPGFDASRIVDTTHFTEPDTQNIAITVTPQAALPNLNVHVGVWENPNAILTITSPTTDEAQGIWLYEGRKLHIEIRSPVVGTTYTYYVTIEVEPLVPEVEFMPDVNIGWVENVASGTGSGSSLSHFVPELGTWTWSATGNYVWHWWEDLQRGVHFESHCDTPPPNNVAVLFNTVWTHTSSGDAFSDTEVTGSQSWQAQILNNPDSAEDSVTNTVLRSDGTLAFDWAVPEPITMGPPIEWFFGNVLGEEVYGAAVGFTSDPITFTPGFDASRSFDRTQFPESGIQTLTISVTPTQEVTGLLGMGLLMIDVLAREDDGVCPIIISQSGADFVFKTHDGHHSLMGRGNLVVGTEYSFTVAIQVEPKMSKVEFMPHVRVYTVGIDGAGPSSGNSVSYTVPEVCSWTWTAEGNYEWMWLEGDAKAVSFSGCSNSAPVANAGMDQTIDEGDGLILDGSGSFDPDGDPLDAQWTFGDETFAGLTVTLTPADSEALKDDFEGDAILTVTDPSGEVATDLAHITVLNVPPIIHITGDTINENGEAMVSGTMFDPGTYDDLIVVIDWGEGSSEIFTYPAGTTSFTVTHQYLDTTPTGTFGVAATVIDSDDDTGSGTATVTVNNVAPTMSVPSVLHIDENGVASISGTITDPGTLDTFTMVIDWGEGPPETLTYPAGTTSFTVTHQYLDDNPTGTPSDEYTVTITVTDDDGGTDSGTVTVTVDNVAPTVSIAVVPPTPPVGEVVTVFVGDEIGFTGSFTDPGTLDTHTTSWDFGDGTTVEGDLAPTHAYGASNTYTVALTVTDDDGGIGTAAVEIRVQTPSEAINDLIGMLNDMLLQHGIENSLDSKLQNARNALDAANAGNRQDAINKLEAFINAVEALRGEYLTDGQADNLIEKTKEVIDHI